MGVQYTRNRESAFGLYEGIMQITKTIIISVCLCLGLLSVKSMAQMQTDKLISPNNGRTGITCKQNGLGSDNPAVTSYHCADNKDGQIKYQKTNCAIKLPILCFRDINAPAPKSPNVKGHWSGGVVAATPPQKGGKFTHIEQINAYCQSLFGKDWRVVSYHDGNDGRIVAYGRQLENGKKVWVDIRSQSKQNCWR